MKAIRAVVLFILIQNFTSANSLDSGWNLWTSTVSSHIETFFQNNPEVRVIWGYDSGLWNGAARDSSDQELLTPLYPKLNFLTSGYSYWIKVDSAVDMLISTIGSDPSNPATSCKEILNTGASKGDGFYWIKLDQIDFPISVECNMTKWGGGWTILDSNYFKAVDTLTTGDSLRFQQVYAEGSSSVTTPTTGPVFIVPATVAYEADLYLKFTEYMLDMRYQGEGLTGVQSLDFGRYSNSRFISNDMETISETHFSTVAVTPDLPSKIWDCPTPLNNPVPYGSCSLKDESFSYLKAIVNTDIQVEVLTGLDYSEYGSAIGTDKQVHDIYAGGVYISSDTIFINDNGSYHRAFTQNLASFDTINRYHYIQSTPITSKLRIKMTHDQNHSPVYITVQKLWVR